MKNIDGLWIVEWTAVYTTTKGVKEYTKFYLAECRGKKMFQTLSREYAKKYRYRTAYKHMLKLVGDENSRADLLGLRTMFSIHIIRIPALEAMGIEVAKEYAKLYGKEGK